MNDQRTMKVTPVDETTSDLLLIHPPPDRADRLIQNCDKDLAAEMAKRWNQHEDLKKRIAKLECHLKAFVRIADNFKEFDGDSPRSALKNYDDLAGDVRELLKP